MFENIQNSVWHAFDYISVETGRVEALKSKLKVGNMMMICLKKKFILVSNHIDLTGKNTQGSLKTNF